jgi:hypothetical protein
MAIMKYWTECHKRRKQMHQKKVELMISLLDLIMMNKNQIMRVDQRNTLTI